MFSLKEKRETCTHLQSNIMMNVKFAIRTGPEWELRLPSLLTLRAGRCPEIGRI